MDEAQIDLLLSVFVSGNYKGILHFLAGHPDPELREHPRVALLVKCCDYRLYHTTPPVFSSGFNAQEIERRDDLFEKKIIYALRSTPGQIRGLGRINAPVHISNKGKILVSDGVQFGGTHDPYLHERVIFLDVRTERGSIAFGRSVVINNGVSIVSESSQGIRIGEHSMVGPDVRILDSDFHALDPKNWTKGPAMGGVSLGRNVFIGWGATILKGVSIGDNSVVAANAVVTGNHPANVVIGGVPARIIRHL